MSTETFSLSQLGWRPFYSQQLTLDDLDIGFPARVASVQRSHLVVLAESGEHSIRAEPAVTVGDWVLVQNQTLHALRVFNRESLIARLAPGTEQRTQLIAANVDTLLIVTSCNADFNLSRLERYLAVAFEAQVTPIIVLTKADECADAAPFVTQAQGVASTASVIALNATDAAGSIAALAPWLGAGQTVAFVGSSGVGKSTLINSLLGVQAQSTGAIREADSKGRHTTTARHLIRAPAGVWLIDTPGMRELAIGAVQTGIEKTFGDIEELAKHCRYRDCSHQQDDGCALRAAVANGRLEPRRFASYLKLGREAERALRKPWQRHQEERQFGRLARAAQKQRRRDTGRE